MNKRNLWATPVWEHNLTNEISSTLFADILHELEITTDLNRGLNKEDVVNQRDYPSILNLFNTHIHKLAQAYAAEVFDSDIENFDIWTTSTDSQGMNPHYHQGSAFTAIAYIKTPTAKQGGDLILIDPRFNAVQGYPEAAMLHHFRDVRIQPKELDVVIFPNYLLHYVKSVQDQVERISIPCSYRLKDKTRSYLNVWNTPD